MFDIDSKSRLLYDIVGAIYRVIKDLGPGLNEHCYQEALSIELEERSIKYQRELAFAPTYHGRKMQASFRLDFLCKGEVIIECKAVEQIAKAHRMQLFNYMRLTKKPCGILVNFWIPHGEIERYYYDEESDSILNIYGQAIFIQKLS